MKYVEVSWTGRILLVPVLIAGLFLADAQARIPALFDHGDSRPVLGKGRTAAVPDMKGDGTSRRLSGGNGSVGAWPGDLLKRYLSGEGGSSSQRRNMSGRAEKRAYRRRVAMILRRADELLRKGGTGPAEKLLRTALREYPASVKLLTALAVVLERKGRHGEARRVYKRIISLDGTNVQALVAFGNVLTDRVSDYEQARSLFRKALSIDPRSASAWDGLGWLAYKKGRLDEASELFRKAARLDSSAPMPRYHLGLVALQRKQIAAALSAFRDVVKADPSFHKAHVSLGLLYAKLGEKAKAMEELGKALALIGFDGPVAARIMEELRRLDPRWRPTDSLSYRTAYRRRGLPSSLLPATEAVASREHVVSVAASGAPSRRAMPKKAGVGGTGGKSGAGHSGPSSTGTAGSAQGRLRRHKAVRKSRFSLLPERSVKKDSRAAGRGRIGGVAMEAAVETSAGLLKQTLVSDHMRLGRLYYQVGLNRDAAGEFQTVINLAPLSSEARDARDLVEALSDFADPPDREKIEGYFQVGATLFRKADFENAKLQYKKILLLDPVNAKAHKNLAYVYLKQGRVNEAWTHVEQALEHEPDYMDALVIKAYILAKRRNFSQACELFRKVQGLAGPDGALGRYAAEMARKMAMFTELR